MISFSTDKMPLITSFVYGSLSPWHPKDGKPKGKSQVNNRNVTSPKEGSGYALKPSRNYLELDSIKM